MLGDQRVRSLLAAAMPLAASLLLTSCVHRTRRTTSAVSPSAVIHAAEDEHEGGRRPGLPREDRKKRSEERRVGSDWSSDVCSSDLSSHTANDLSSFTVCSNTRGRRRARRWAPPRAPTRRSQEVLGQDRRPRSEEHTSELQSLR